MSEVDVDAPTALEDFAASLDRQADELDAVVADLKARPGGLPADSTIHLESGAIAYRDIAGQARRSASELRGGPAHG